MKKIYTLLLLAICLSCQEAEDPKLEIFNFEYGRGGDGHGDDRIGYIGADLHFAAEVYAEKRMDEVVLSIIDQNGEAVQIWDYSDNYKGIRNPHIHEHPVISNELLAGDYQIQFKISDQIGQQTKKMGDLKLLSSMELQNIAVEGEILPGEEIHIAFGLLSLYPIKDVNIEIISSLDETISNQYYNFSHEDFNYLPFSDKMKIEEADATNEPFHIKITANDKENNTLIYTYSVK
ncbi:DUF4625 domain-containing protein [Persicobacter diffluens]|uniref:DUF4625 domain-containing protein n=1 Tax=Persicobacter diffluens TaxID=981 RepID=A0AAN4W2M3_9BACT|nr:hypothetical protein PEDI_33920 [Persicobacter diffluens]